MKRLAIVVPFSVVVIFLLLLMTFGSVPHAEFCNPKVDARKKFRRYWKLYLKKFKK